MATQIDQQAKYTESHEWVRMEEGVAVIGVTDYAQETLSDVVYADLPQIGDRLVKGDTFGALESVKAAEDLVAPISGTVTEVNDEIVNHPEWVNRDPYGKAWLVKVMPEAHEEYDRLLDAATYEALLAKEK